MTGYTGYCSVFGYCIVVNTEITLISSVSVAAFYLVKPKNKKENKPLDLKSNQEKMKFVFTPKTVRKFKTIQHGKISLIQSPGKILVKVLVHKEKESKH